MVRLFWFTILAAAIAGPAAASDTPCWIQDAASVEGAVWLLCDRDQLFASSDGGTEWRVSRLPTQTRLRAIAFLDSRRGFVVGDGGTVLSSKDGGETWESLSVPTKENLRDIHFAGESGWIAGHSGTLLHSADGGVTWSVQLTGTSQALESVYFVDGNYGWAVGWSGIILRTTNGGKGWEEVRCPEAQWSLNSVYFRDRKNGWAVGFFGQLLRSRDGGSTWEAQPTPVKASLHSVFFDGFGRGWITAQDDILLSEDGGDSWRAVGLTGRWFLERLIPVRDSVWAVGPFSILKQQGREIAWSKLSNLPEPSS
jgi:photosystem II stability/assembly factor-like uncharacterized protein